MRVAVAALCAAAAAAAAPRPDRPSLADASAPNATAFLLAPLEIRADGSLALHAAADALPERWLLPAHDSKMYVDVVEHGSEAQRRAALAESVWIDAPSAVLSFNCAPRDCHFGHWLMGALDALHLALHHAEFGLAARPSHIVYLNERPSELPRCKWITAVAGILQRRAGLRPIVPRGTYQGPVVLPEAALLADFYPDFVRDEGDARLLRDWIWASARATYAPRPPPGKVLRVGHFVRPDGRRRVHNTEAIWAAIEQAAPNGARVEIVEIVFTGNDTLAEQVHKVRDLDMAVGTHGQHCLHAFYMPPQSVFVEVLPPLFPPYVWRQYPQLAHAAGVHYLYLDRTDVHRASLSAGELRAVDEHWRESPAACVANLECRIVQRMIPAYVVDEERARQVMAEALAMVGTAAA